MTRSLLATTIALTLMAAGCGDDDGGDGQGTVDGGVDCSTVTGVDDFAIGLSKTGDNGYTVAIASATPAPPARGNNTWTVEVNDASSAAAAGRTLDVEPFMPHHGHGSPIPAVVTETADGEYELDPLNLFMPGVWEVTIAIRDGDTLEDSVVFNVCIEG